MTTELSKLQIQKPPTEKKNDRRQLVHGDGLAKLAGPQEIEGPGHAAAGATVVKDERENAGQRNGAKVHTGEAGKGVSSGERSKAEAHELFAGEDCAAQGQRVLLQVSL
jgi:hypothetical protein